MRDLSGRTVLIRADATVHSGSGHVMRCLALAEELRARGATAIFVAAELSAGIKARLSREKFPVREADFEPGSRKDIESTLALANELEADWVIIDGYQLGADFQLEFLRHGQNMMAIDDYGHAGSYRARFVLNQNLYASESFYLDRGAETKLLLGPAYVLLRDEFLNHPRSERSSESAPEKILLTLGGADEPNAAAKILQLLELVKSEKLQVRVVAGPQNPHVEGLMSLARGSRHEVTVFQSTDNMPTFMTWADLVISGGGATCYELCYLSTPFMTLILAENQVVTADSLAKAGISENLGWYNKLSEAGFSEAWQRMQPGEERKKRADQGRRLIDGVGRSRVADLLFPPVNEGAES